MSTHHWTSQDLETLPDDSKRYEIIEGELHVTEIPHLNHQAVCVNVAFLLEQYNGQNHAGVTVFAPGIIFSEDDDVAPDVVWISRERLTTALWLDGHLHSAPELVVEVLSPGEINERWDRETKRKLYSRPGVLEYWIANWRTRQIEVYRREEMALRQVGIIYEKDTLQSPYLPGLCFQVREVFAGII